MIGSKRVAYGELAVSQEPKRVKTKVFGPKEVKAIKAIASKNLEVKRFSIYDGAQSVAQNVQGVVYSDLSQVPQGDGQAQRIGEKIRATQVELKYNLYSTSASTDFLVRVVLASVDQFTYTDATETWFESVDGDDQAPTANRLQDIFYSMNKDKITVLYDKVHKMNDVSDGGGRGNTTIKRMIPFKRVMNFGSNDTQDARHNNLRLFFLVRDPSTANASGTDSVTITNYTVLHYIDA